MKKNLQLIALVLTAVMLLSSCTKTKETCSDGIKNQDETKTDCGGSCSPCPTCSDGILNQHETRVDCGGECAPCPSCWDGVKNQDETGVDCGGVCFACPTCSDGIQNQGEIGVDCGGPCPLTSACANNATQNTSLIVGGNNWTTFFANAPTGSILKCINGSIEVTITFPDSGTSGFYSVGTTPNSCQLQLKKAPGQPADAVWIGRNGTMQVTNSAGTATVIMNNIICTQQSYNFPAVNVNGNITFKM